jgi:endoglucanase
MIAGHLDEIGFQVAHIDDNGFLYIAPVGGHDLSLVPGRRVLVHTRQGSLPAVIGKKAIHLQTEEERKKVPLAEDLWIDIGAHSGEEARAKVSIGDSVTHDERFTQLDHQRITAKALDDRAGAFIAAEVLTELATRRSSLSACVMAVATTQEEIGARGAITASHLANPNIGICVDVTHATDCPGIDPRKYGLTKLGGGPCLMRGSSVAPQVYEKLVEAAEASGTSYQTRAVPGLAPNDTRSIQISGAGVATGTIGIPLRYMHTPSEIADLDDLEGCINLLVAFCLSAV